MAVALPQLVMDMAEVEVDFQAKEAEVVMVAEEVMAEAVVVGLQAMEVDKVEAMAVVKAAMAQEEEEVVVGALAQALVVDMVTEVDMAPEEMKEATAAVALLTAEEAAVVMEAEAGVVDMEAAAEIVVVDLEEVRYFLIEYNFVTRD